MTFSLSGHLVRRAVEAAPGIQAYGRDGLTDTEREALERLGSPKSIFLLGTTIAAYLIVSFLIEYTVRFVIGNLAIVEDTQPSQTNIAGYAPLPSEKEALLADTESARAGTPEKPITRTLRSALRHLRGISGFSSYFRGIKIFLVYSFLSGVLNILFYAAFAMIPIGMFVSHVLTAILTSRLHCAWTHATLRTPSTKNTRQMTTPILHLESLEDSSKTKAIAVPLHPEYTIIGRSIDKVEASNGLFHNLTMSRQHAKVWADENGTVWLQDSASSNGTFVNGQRLSEENVVSPPMRLAAGDSIAFGTDIMDDSKTIKVHQNETVRVGLSEEQRTLSCRQRCSIRYISRAESRHVILPAIRVEIAMGVAQFATRTAFSLSRSHLAKPGTQTHGCKMLVSPSSIFFGILPIFVLLFTTLVLVVPAMIARVRTEAALLPESEQTIIPLDRSFGGRVDLSTESKVLYIRRQLTLPGAWLAFDCATYRRVLKVWAKYHVILMALAFATMVSVAAEVYLILGDMGLPDMARDVVKRWEH